MKRPHSTARIAETFDVDESTVKRWVTDGCPCGAGGKGKPRKFNEAEVAAWLREKGLTGKIGRPPESDDEALLQAKVRKENALADRHELAVAREKGLLVEKAVVDRSNVTKVVAVRNRLMSVGVKLAAQLEGLTIMQRQKLIDGEMNDIVNDFSKKEP